jgi:D-alanine-D-alanine ligase-like ATP-grasp enzyme
MIQVARGMPDIAVLRGGGKSFKTSLFEGAEVLGSLKKIGYQPLDVLISTEGAWTVGGMPTDAHTIFTRAHTVIDTTRTKGERYHDLAKRMGVILLFSNAHDMTLDREDVYRLLRQQDIKVPDTVTVRANAPLKDSLFRELWLTHHTPLMIRPLVRRDDAPSRLIKLFSDLENTIREYHNRGIDTHILTYKKAPTSSIAVLPNFRGERLYTPLWVETFASVADLPNSNSRMRVHTSAPEFRKNQIKDFITNVYDALGLSGPACIDIIPSGDGYMVVNVDTNPSLRKDSRFMQSLDSTGTNIGQYIHSQIRSDLE